MNISDKLKNFKEKHKNKKWFIFFKNLLFGIASDDVTGAGAQLSYYFILAIFPFLIFLLSIISFTPLVGEEVLSSLFAILPGEARTVVSGIANELIATRSETLLSSSIILSLWTGSLGITGLFKSINKAYDVDETRPYWKHKLLSVVFTITLAALMIIVLSMLVFGEVIANQLFTFLGVEDLFYDFWQTIRFVVPLLSLITVFTGLYIIAPSTTKENRITLKYALPGAIFTSLGWVITSIGFAFYVRNFASYSATYGSLGGIIILLVWLNITNIIIVVGGEVNGALKRTNKEVKKANKEVKRNYENIIVE